MATEGDKVTAGWGWPDLASKSHYFVDGISLCRRWGFGGKIDPDPKGGPDDCKACTKLLAARQAKAAKK